MITAKEAKELQKLIINSNDNQFLESHKDLFDEIDEQIRMAALQGKNHCRLYATYKIFENEFNIFISIMEDLEYKINIDKHNGDTIIYVYW